MTIKMYRPERYDLALIDSSNLIYRHHAKLGQLCTDDGRKSGALYGTIRFLFRILKEHKPWYCCVVFDSPNNARKELNADYKANRAQRPDYEDVQIQIRALREFCELVGIRTALEDGKEADDLIGSLAAEASKREAFKTLIVSNDHDMDQLITNNTHVLKNKDVRKLEHVVREYGGLHGRRIAEIQAITGCDTDNVIGVKGYGPKKALAAIQKYGGLANVIENDPKLAIYGDKLRENFKLVRLAPEPCETSVEDSLIMLERVVPQNLSEIRAWLQDWQMTSIARALRIDMTFEEELLQ